VIDEPTDNKDAQGSPNFLARIPTYDVLGLGPMMGCLTIGKTGWLTRMIRSDGNQVADAVIHKRGEVFGLAGGRVQAGSAKAE